MSEEIPTPIEEVPQPVSADAGPKTALLIVDHGSRRDEANLLVDEIAAKVRWRAVFDIVEIAHMEVANPDIPTAMARCVDRGATTLIVMPYFLASGNHVSIDIPEIVGEAAANFDGLVWKVTEPLGLDERLVDLVIERAQGAS